MKKDYLEQCIPRFFRRNKTGIWKWNEQTQCYSIGDKVIFQRIFNEKYKHDGWALFAFSEGEWKEHICDTEQERDEVFRNPEIILMEQSLS